MWINPHSYHHSHPLSPPSFLHHFGGKSLKQAAADKKGIQVKRFDILSAEKLSD
jgi:hypothetical protein